MKDNQKIESFVRRINRPKSGFVKLKDVLKNYGSDLERDKYISREFQKYGYDLAEELGDLKHKALYIKLAKEEKRSFLETARNFVKDAYGVKSKAKLFMWRLNELKNLRNKEIKNEN